MMIGEFEPLAFAAVPCMTRGMPEVINLPLIVLAHFVASVSPGPATLAIAGTSMASGRKYGLALAAGVTSASLMWSIVAALGFGAIMLAHAWMFEVMRYFGAGYLIFLAVKSARSALRRDETTMRRVAETSLQRAYLKGVILHLTNPKAVLFFGSLYAIGVPAGSSPSVLATIILVLGLQSLVVCQGYALLFSIPAITKGYMRLSRWFEAAFAVAFGAAGLAILAARM